MKVSQLVVGGVYESKDGKEIRRILGFGTDIVRFAIVPIVSGAKAAREQRLLPTRTNEASKQNFAAWAARKQGTSTFRSVDGQKFLNRIPQPKG